MVGGTTVGIIGAGFYSSNPFVIKARRMDLSNLITVQRVNSTLLQFNTLQASGAQSGVMFEFMANGEQYTSIPTPFAYYSPPVVTSIFPHAGPVSGGTTVIVTGYFYNTGIVRAMFGGAGPIACVYVNSSQVVCVSPQSGAAGSGDLSIAVDTNDNAVIVYSTATAGSPWMYYADPVLTLMNPPLGMRGNLVSIVGSGFVATPDGMSVIIGSIAFPCKITTATMLSCVVPSLPPAIYGVKLSLNTQNFHACAEPFVVYRQPDFTMAPTLSPQHGFALVVLTAQNASLGAGVMNIFGGFVNSSRQNYMVVRIGSELLSATLIDYLHARVWTTPFPSTATQAVSLSLNGQNFTSSLPLALYGVRCAFFVVVCACV
jgi:hypothetical protein